VKVSGPDRLITFLDFKTPNKQIKRNDRKKIRGSSGGCRAQAPRLKKEPESGEGSEAVRETGVQLGTEERIKHECNEHKTLISTGSEGTPSILMEAGRSHRP